MGITANGRFIHRMAAEHKRTLLFLHAMLCHAVPFLHDSMTLMGPPVSGHRRIPANAALEPHSPHKLRGTSESPLSDSWAEIERQLDSSRSTRNGHLSVVDDRPLYSTQIIREYSRHQRSAGCCHAIEIDRNFDSELIHARLAKFELSGRFSKFE